MDLSNIKKVHLIGIGGIGVSALARLFIDKQKQVKGSDLFESKITKQLELLGIEIFIDHQLENLDEETDLVVYSPAINGSNPELIKAKKLGIETLSYPQALGLISKDYSLIAVSGTHGKTTTTAMSAKVLIEAGLDPTVVVGSLLKEQQTNYIKGEGKNFLVEACEYKRSFLNFTPHILIITNIDLDHLDYFKDLEDIQSAFIEVVSKLSQEDYLICDTNHPNLKPIIDSANCQIVNFKDFKTNDLTLKVSGEHNVENAQSVLALTEVLKIDKQITIDSLNNFSGTWRRFEYKGKTDEGLMVYDDYAHNPTEVRVTLKGAREMFSNKKITVVFQPHLYSRTKTFLSEFSQSFESVDNIIILPIYAARESFDPSITSEMLVDKINGNNKEVVFSSDFKSALDEINKIENKDVVITMGAGDVWKVGEMVLN